MQRPRLYQVVPRKDYTVVLFYDNGEIKLYDCRWIKEETGVFEKIRGLHSFLELCTVMNGTLAWDISGKRDPYNCIDICPDTVYQESRKIHRQYLREYLKPA